MDPRPAILRERLSGVRHIIAVAGGKGGVGKSTVAATLALVLAERGARTGLLDLDFYGPSAHLLLGARGLVPAEDHGLIPPQVHGLRFMSLVFYAGDEPAPIRGEDVSNAFIELLAVTRWGALDALVVDMPPGTGDATLDVIRLLDRARFLVVTTPSRLAAETVRKLVDLLAGVGAPILGVVENMRRSEGTPSGPDRAVPAGTGANAAGAFPAPAALALPFLGALPYDDQLEEALGDPSRLLATPFARALAALVARAPDFRGIVS